MKKLILILINILAINVYPQQHTLYKDYNAMRENDSIMKLQVTFKAPGRSGENVLWDFGRLNVVNDSYLLSYLKRDSLIIGREHQTSYRYYLKKDSLFTMGYANPTTRFNYIQPELQLIYPFAYMDSIGSYFYGEGKYGGKIYFRSLGKAKIKADAYGVIVLPNQDTLRHVLRTYTVKTLVEKMSPADSILFTVNRDWKLLDSDSIQENLNSDSIRMEIETYRWYARGYRYPVFETVRSNVYKLNKLIDYFQTAFFYPPNEQAFLEKDELNYDLLEKDLLWKANRDKSIDANRKEKGDKMQKDKVLTYNTYPNPVQDNLFVELYVQDDLSVGITLSDMQGRILQMIPGKDVLAGIYEYSIPMNGYPRGEYLVSFIVGENVFSEKIIKN